MKDCSTESTEKNKKEFFTTNLANLHESFLNVILSAYICWAAPQISALQNSNQSIAIDL